MFCYGMAWHSSGGAWRRNDLRSIGTVWRDVAAARNGTVWQGNGYARISHARAKSSIDLQGEGIVEHWAAKERQSILSQRQGWTMNGYALA